MKKSFTPDTTAAAELFTTPAKKETKKTQPETITATTAEPTIKKSARLTPPPAPETIDTTNALSWRAKPDGETRSRRLQITSKPSIADKAAKLARANGISLNYLFELLITNAWNEATGDSDK